MGTIRGKLLDADTQKPLPQLRVQAWTAKADEERLLGETVSDPQGAFVIKFGPVDTDVFFRVLRGDALLLDTTGRVVWNDAMNSTPVLIPVPTTSGPPPARPFNTAGVVADEKGVAAVGVKVEVWDRNVAGGLLLGQAVTDAQGRYSVDYDPAILDDKPRADLEIRVLDPAAGGQEVAAA